MKFRMNVVSAHISAFVAAVVSLIAIVHPGFTVPTVVQTVASSVSILVAGAIEVYHLLTHRQLQTALAIATTTVQKAETAAKTTKTKA